MYELSAGWLAERTGEEAKEISKRDSGQNVGSSLAPCALTLIAGNDDTTR